MTTTEAVRTRIEAIPAGTPFAIQELLPCGSRAAVDQVLSRLVKAGALRRVTRGIYVRSQVHPLLGEKVPEVEAILRLKTGGELLISGAMAQHRFGLTEQMPVRPTYYTPGPSRTVRINRLACQLIHRSSGWFALGTGPAGEAVVALRSLGQSRVSLAVLDQIRTALAPEEYEKLLTQHWQLPGWLSSILGQAEQVRRNHAE
ncbi:MAG: DUF6088 family protein [bacterium]